MKRMYLHAGLHKTGTTAIQRFCRKNRVLLRERGVLYPHTSEIVGTRSQEGHHHLAHSIAGASRVLDNKKISTFVEYCKDEAGRQSIPVLISSESMARHRLAAGGSDWLDQRRAYLKSVQDWFRGFHVHVLLVLRRQDDYADSLYREQVANAGKIQFHRFLRVIAPQSLRFLDQIRLFEDIFDEITVLTYEDLKQPPGLATNLLRHVGIDVSDCGNTPYTRKSLCPRRIAVKRLLNEHVGEKGPERRRRNRALREFLSSETVQSILDREWPMDHPSLWKSADERAAFRDQFEEENEKIRQLYFPDKSRLFPVGGDDGEVNHIGPVPDELYTSILSLARKEGLLVQD